MADVKKNTLNVRIKNKYDSYETWASAGVILEAGEIAIAHTTVDVKEGNGTVKHPAILMKVGDGEHTFAQLPWLSAKAADVADWAKAEAKPVYAASEITGIADYIADYVSEEMGIEMDTDTQYQIVANGENGFKLQSKGKGESAWADVEGSTFAVDFTAVNNEITGIKTVLGEVTSLAEEFAKYDTTAVVEGKIKAVADDLAGYKTANDALVKANGDAITAIKDGASIDSFADVEAALAGKQATGDYATKAEAQGYANAKDQAIADALAAGQGAQAGVNALNAKVNLAEGETVKGLIETAKGEAISDATAHVAGVNSRLDALEGKVGENNIAEELAKYETLAAANEFKGEVAQYKTANDARVKAIEDDYLKAADKTALQNQIDLIMNNPDTDKVIDSITEFTAYIEEHGGIADGFRTDIDKNKEDIKAITDDYLKAADKNELNGAINGLDGRLDTAEGEIDALQADISKKATKDELEAVAAKLPEEGTVPEYVAAEIGKLEINTYAKAADLEALDDKVDALKIEDLGQAAGTYIVFDCGTASTII